MNKYCIILLTHFFFLSAFPSDTTSVNRNIQPDSIQQHFFSLSPSFNYYKLLDFQSSPILYKGLLAGLKLAFESDGYKHKYNISLGGNYGKINGKTENVSYPATQTIAYFNSSYVHSIGGQRIGIRKFVGSSIKQEFLFYYNQNLQNAALSLTGLAHLSATAEFEKYFSWKSKQIKIWFVKFNRRDRKVRFNFKLDIPVFFYNLRSPYSSISDFSNGENNWDLEPKSYWIFGRAFQLNTKTSLTYYLHNNNAFRLSYLWQANKFQDTFDSYQTGQHVFEFSLLFRFN